MQSESSSQAFWFQWNLLSFVGVHLHVYICGYMFVYSCVFESYPNLNYPSVRFLRDGVAGLVGSVSEPLFHPFYNPSQTAWICKVEAQVCQLPHFPVIAASPLNKRRKKARLM